MPECQDMLDNYAANVSPTSRKKYVTAVARFVDFSQGDFSHDRLLSYIQHLQKQGYAPGTIKKFDLTSIRRFYKLNGLAWPLKTWETPTIKEGDVYAPALSPELIAQMISAIKFSPVPGEETALLALSTTYGLRRIEMITIRPQDLLLERRLVHIKTAKHGRERWHIIPAAIIPYLETWRPGSLTPTTASKTFYRLEKATGLPRMNEVGWHSIRRALVRGLVQARLPEPMIRDFLRWKRGASSDMLLSYYSTQVVGLDHTHTAAGRRDEETEREVFARHPFLPLWEG